MKEEEVVLEDHQAIVGKVLGVLRALTLTLDQGIFENHPCYIRCLCMMIVYGCTRGVM